MLLTKTVLIKALNNVKYFRDKGYYIPPIKGSRGRDTFRNSIIEVNTEDLPNGSHSPVCVRCDGCGKISDAIPWRNYKRYVHEDGKYYCTKCKKKCMKYISFEQYCYNNMPVEDADKLLDRWDYDLNYINGKKLSPKDISYSSDGFNSKGYWFKCLEHYEHGSELKSINSFVHGHGTVKCIKCSMVAMTHPHLIKYLVNKEDATKFSIGSEKMIPMKCPDCGYEKPLPFGSLNTRGFCCICSDGIPYPEKFFMSVLQQLNVIFECQLTNTTFKWCGIYRYDFYITELNSIVETHGGQHYKQNTGNWDLLSDIQRDDKLKEDLALNNGIEKDNYIVINCRMSDLEFIKNNIINSELAKLFDLSQIDWLKCHEFACKSLVRTACDLWKDGVKILKIADKLKISRSTITRYLKQGAELKLCAYIPRAFRTKKEIIEEAAARKKIRVEIETRMRVICFTTGEIFRSAEDAAEQMKAHSSSILKCCKNKLRSSGKHPKTGEPLTWMHYVDYLKLTPKEIQEKKHEILILQESLKGVSVICLNTQKVFRTIQLAGKYYNMKSNAGIRACCSGQVKYSGKSPETGESLKWMYYEDYLKSHNIDNLNYRKC